ALEDVATDYFGVQVSSFRFEELVNDALAALPKEDPRAGMIGATALLIRGRAEKFIAKVQPLLGETAVRLTPSSLSRAEFEVKELLESLSALSTLTVGAEEVLLTALCRRAGEIADELDFIRKAESAEHVFWAE